MTPSKKIFFLCMILAIYKISCIPANDREQLQNSITKIFGLDNRPRPDVFSMIGRDTSAKKYMIGLYNYSQDKEEKDIKAKAKIAGNNLTNEIIDDADTIVSFVNDAYVPRPNATDDEGAMFFDVQSNLVIESTLASELRIYLNITNKQVADNVFRVTVYQIIRPKRKFLVLSSRVINATESQWHEFDVLKASNAWREDSINNKGVLVICETMNNREIKFSECGLVDFNGKNEYRPFLVSFYQSGDEDEILAEQLHPEVEITTSKILAHERLRRSLGELFPRASKVMPSIYQNNSKRDNSTCSKHPLYIAFKDLGWSDWIIAPEGYKAAYCDGECGFPLHDKMNASNHAIIQTLVHMIDPSAIPEPCCAPVRLTPLKVLYLDEFNNIIMKTYGSMIVNDCGCQ